MLGEDRSAPPTEEELYQVFGSPPSEMIGYQGTLTLNGEGVQVLNRDIKSCLIC